MKYVNLEESTNKILGFYDDKINKNIPKNCIEISFEDWKLCLNENLNCFENGKFIKKDFTTEEDLNKQFNQQIYSKIEDLEKKQFRSFKALTFNPADEVAQNLFNQYEQEITDLRSQLI